MVNVQVLMSGVENEGKTRKLSLFSSFYTDEIISLQIHNVIATNFVFMLCLKERKGNYG